MVRDYTGVYGRRTDSRVVARDFGNFANAARVAVRGAAFSLLARFHQGR